MATLTIHTAAGDVSVEVRSGDCLADVLGSHGHAPDMPCGGAGRCGKCRIQAAGSLSAPTPAEEQMLTADERAQGIRLACMTHILGDAEVYPFSHGAQAICSSGVAVSFPLDPLFSRLGAAIDIGTTTLAAQLYDHTGLLSTAAAPNPQASYGADVITRIGRAIQGADGALAQCLKNGLRSLLEALCAPGDRSVAEIDALVITGNTAMLHLLTGENTAPLAAVPFLPRRLFGEFVSGDTLELGCAPGAPVYLPRCISAFVGGDITTAITASGMCKHTETALLVDIGTNGEVALWHNGQLTCCSTAAGPAFEGACLSHGVQGIPGAIDHASAGQGKLQLHTIGGGPAVGICGSGVIDITAALLALGQLDETGHLEDGDLALTDTVSITQQDIRQIQLAKAAVRAGMEALLHHAGLKKADVQRVYLAGGFGSYLNLNSAADIGLLPPEFVSKTTVLGNAALSGARMLLQSRGLPSESFAMAEAGETWPLASDPVFRDLYVEHMLFPE